ncbi:glycosyltransferase family 69 protein [Melanogaster broomeanus]|nr:glycosyltransferase family 69 protein [Melanogaster broomeanus]
MQGVTLTAPAATASATASGAANASATVSATAAAGSRVPTPLVLLMGLLLGLLIGRSLPCGFLAPSWVDRPIFVSRLSARKQFTLPSTEQRHRSSSCSPRSLHTIPPNAHVTPNPLYAQQVRERYQPLIGYKPPTQSSWLSSIGLAILGYHNVYVSIYENGSTDQTKALLRIFDALTKSVGLRVTIRTSTRTRGAFNHRIEYLAEVRNQAFNPLHELRDSHNEYFDSIIFMNDILPCVDDLLELIWQSRRNNAGITCAADYMYHEYPCELDVAAQGTPVFYDNWMHLPLQVQSCWNGIAVLDPAPFYTPPYVRFRMARLAEEECSASECSLICNDYWEAGYGRILMVPRVKLAYDNQGGISPPYGGYARLGGLPDNPRTDPQDRSWFGPHDRLFTPEESEEIDFVPGPSHVWCWGWDGAGDIDGPDVDPIWEQVPRRSQGAGAVTVKHQRQMDGL